MIAYGINRKCEWPFEATDIESASISTDGQGIV